MHYSSRGDKFALAKFLNNSQKNIKKSLVQEVYQKSNIIESRIFFYSTKLKKKLYIMGKVFRKILKIILENFQTYFGKINIQNYKILRNNMMTHLRKFNKTS